MAYLVVKDLIACDPWAWPTTFLCWCVPEISQGASQKVHSQPHTQNGDIDRGAPATIVLKRHGRWWGTMGESGRREGIRTQDCYLELRLLGTNSQLATLGAKCLESWRLALLLSHFNDLIGV